MNPDPFNRTRYRTLRAAVVLIALLACGGAVTMLRLPRVQPFELALFVASAFLMIAMLPVARRAAEADNRRRLELLGMITIGVACLLVLERIFSTLYGRMFEDPAVDLFRLHFAVTAVVFLAAFAVLPAKLALRFCWLAWAVVLAVTLPGLYFRTGFDFSRPGLASLLVWLLLANPLFILLMHALPHYEDQLERTKAEVEDLRSRTELMDVLAEKERRFNMVVDSLEVGVWDRWIGPPERRWWSPRFYELIGYTPDEMPPSEERLIDLLHPDDRDRVFKAGTEQLRNSDIMDVDFRFNTRHRGYRWFNSHAKADRDASGKIVRLAGSITDIHDRRMAEDALRAAQAELTRLAYRDTLTALYNRRYFDEHFQREWERSRRSRQPLALLLIDLDHFKAYNDLYGHPAGDTCLVHIAQLLTRCASRPADIVARLGGEEFGIVLPETDAQGAEEVAQRMQALLRTAAIPHGGAPTQTVTMSAGVSAIEGPEGPGPSELFEQADKALYEVKRRGRNGILRYRREMAGSTKQAALFTTAEHAVISGVSVKKEG